MPTNYIKITKCSDCKFSILDRHYTADSFEMEFDQKCTKIKPTRVIEEYISWHEKPVDRIPDWCPIKE